VRDMDSGEQLQVLPDHLANAITAAPAQD
jgi:hypothetical protein